jgi:hypothetical protein
MMSHSEVMNELNKCSATCGDMFLLITVSLDQIDERAVPVHASAMFSRGYRLVGKDEVTQPRKIKVETMNNLTSSWRSVAINNSRIQELQVIQVE